MEMREKNDWEVEQEITDIVKWLSSYMNEDNKNTFVIGVSGGIDSTVVMRLCEMACNESPYKVLAISMPFSMNWSDSEKRADELCKDRDHVTYHKIYISSIIQAYKATGVGQTKMDEGNLRSRVRANVLYDFAARDNGLVIGTGNKDEDEIGYMTKFGDGAVDICPLSAIHKSVVYQMGKILKVPQSILDAAPTAELWNGQTDEQELGLTYDQIEWAIKTLDNLHDNIASLKEINEIEFLILQKVQLMRKKNAHKLKYPPIYNPIYCV